MNTLPFSQRPTETPRVGHPDDAMLEFNSESTGRHVGPPRRNSARWLIGLLAVVGLTAAGVWTFRTNMKGAAPEGALRIESEPTGAAVEIDGSLRGLTPITLNLAPGQHAVVVSLDAQKQEISANVTRGVQNVHHLRFASTTSPAAASGKGRLQVISEPAGATVTIDGTERGTAPVTVDGLEPGEHQIVVQGSGKAQRRSVTLEAGTTASLVVTNAPAGSESGWLVTKTPTPMQIFEGGKLIGTTEADRLMLSIGTHNLEFVADALGFRARRTVVISAGQTATATMSLPQAQVNLNAVPWAEVTIDGNPSGQTPIANMLLTIGPHDVEFRHPELGSKRIRVMVSLTEPARVAVDMRGR
jgi:PEGA domain-containing protein